MVRATNELGTTKAIFDFWTVKGHNMLECAVCAEEVAEGEREFDFCPFCGSQMRFTAETGLARLALVSWID